MAVGALFIRDNFSLESKVRQKSILGEMGTNILRVMCNLIFVFKLTAMNMIESIRDAFNELLNENHWMDDQTRIVAKAKADAMKEQIGYPDFLTDPEELEKEYIMVSSHNGFGTFVPYTNL